MLAVVFAAFAAQRLWASRSHLWIGFVREYKKLAAAELHDSPGIVINASRSESEPSIARDTDDEALQADVSACEEFHAAVESVHKTVSALNQHLDLAKFESERLQSQLQAERVLAAHLANQQQYIACELARICLAIGLTLPLANPVPNCMQGKLPVRTMSFILPGGAAQFISKIAHQAHTSALLAVSAEEFSIINNTEASQLRVDCTARGRDVANIKKQSPADAKHLKDQASKTTRGHLEQLPGLTEDGRLNLTALNAAMSRHATKWWITSGWEKLRVDTASDWRASFRAVCARRYKSWVVFITRHRMHTTSVRLLEASFWYHVARINTAVHTTTGASLGRQARRLGNVLDQSVQVVTEVGVLVGRLCQGIENQLGFASLIIRGLSLSARWFWSASTRVATSLGRWTFASASALSKRFRIATSIIQQSPGYPATAQEHPAAALLFVLVAPLALFPFPRLLRLPSRGEPRMAGCPS